MAVKALPSQEVLRQLLRYEPETGKLFWLTRDASQMESEDLRGTQWAASHWNRRYSGKEAFTSTDPRGYKKGKILGVSYQAHRVIWKHVYGYDPRTIDHANCQQGDNRLENLRDCTNAENCRNYRKPGGSSLYRGVCWVKRDQKWSATISCAPNGKKSLGHYDSEIDAALAYDAAAKKLHGQFATLNFQEVSA